MPRLGCVAIVAACLLGCGSSPRPAPAAAVHQACPVSAARLAITASPRANATAADEGRPLQVRVYQLKTDARLRAAAFEDVWQNDAKVLADDFVSMEQQTVFPGKTLELAIAPKPDAHYLALVALFREPKGRDWLLSYELSPPPQGPPCPKNATPFPVWIDRMQMQDGSGREEEPDAGADPAPGTR